MGIEPTTARLRIECSTTELLWLEDALARTRTVTPCGTTPSRWRVYQFHHQGTAIPTGPTGLEPATSRVTVECSNQTELRPLARIGARVAHCTATESDLLLPTPRVTAAVNRRAHSRARALTHQNNSPHLAHQSRPDVHSPYGSRTRLCTVKGCRPEPIDERATCHSGNGIRTRVPALRGLCPSPLDDTAACPSPRRVKQLPPCHAGPEGIEPPTAGFGDRCSTN